MQAAMGASLITIGIATAAGWAFGAIWYTVLGKSWMKHSGLTEDDINGPNGKPSPTPFIISFVLEFIMAYIMAVLLIHTSDGAFSFGSAISAAFMLWLGFVATTQAINHRYSMKSWSLTFIDAGHWLCVLLIQAAVMALIGL